MTFLRGARMGFKEFYDISVTLGAGAVDYPADRPFAIHGAASVDADGYTLTQLDITAHSGTHIDAPAHLIPGGLTIDNYSVADFVLPVVVVEVSGDFVRPADLDDAGLRAGDAVLFKTSNSARGLCRAGAFTGDYVYIAPEAASLCVEKGIRLVGIDYLSVDKHEDWTFESHKTLLGAGVLILENIDLSAVPPGSYTLFCAPLKIDGCEAAPARAFLAR